MKTKQQLREHLHTYAQIGVAVGLLMGAIDLWGEDLQAKESALLDQVLSEELTAYEIFESLSTMAEEVSDNATSAPGKTSKYSQPQPSARPSTLSGVNLAKLQSPPLSTSTRWTTTANGARFRLILRPERRRLFCWRSGIRR